jgi:hypothetical protein
MPSGDQPDTYDPREAGRERVFQEASRTVRSRRVPLGGRLRSVDQTDRAHQRHHHREQALDDRVVQVLGDAVAVLEQAQPLGVLPGLCRFQGDGRLPGEGWSIRSSES